MQGADGRIYVIMLDDLHTAALRSQRVKLAAQAVHRALRRRQRSRRGRAHQRPCRTPAQEFTTSQTRLLRAVDKFMGRKLNSSTLNMIDDVQRRAGTPMAGDPAADIDDKERGFNARNALDSIRNVAQYLGNIRGRRKAIVYFSEGIDYDINDMFSNQITEAQTVMDATRDMIAAATRANVAIYAVDPRGLGAEFQDLAAIQSFPDDTSLGLGMSSIFNEVRLSQDSLRVMGDETGGFAVVNRNDFRDAFQRIVDDNSSYYVMGYYSTNDRARRPLPQDRGAAAGPARADGARAQRLRRAARQGAGATEDHGQRSVAGIEGRDGQPVAVDGAAAGAHGGGVQGSRAEGLGGDLDVRRRQHAAVRRERRHDEERPRGPRRRDRRQGQVVLDRSRDREPEHEAGHREARDRHRTSASSSRSSSLRAATTCASPSVKPTRARPDR